jgi:hypothetical protein
VVFNESFFGGGDVPIGSIIIDVLKVIKPEIEAVFNPEISKL